MTNRFQHAEDLVAAYVADYLQNNQAAKRFDAELRSTGVGLRPLLDHITIRTLDVNKRAEEFLDAGFSEDINLGIIEHSNWWAKVYRKSGLPAVFIDQAFAGERGKGNVIESWVRAFGDRTLHHVAVLVDDIDLAMAALEKNGITFGGDIVGEKGTALRQIFTKPDMKNGIAFTVLELAERHFGYLGFLPPQANGLMESTRVVASEKI